MVKIIRDFLDRHVEPLFEKGGPYEKLFPLYEANDTFMYTPGEVTKGNTHVRDALDLKRMMITVVVALLPCLAMALYNTGYQTNLALLNGAPALENWQSLLYVGLGFQLGELNFLANMAHGAIYFLPVFVVTFAVGGGVEVITSIVRGHEVNEGFLVTGFLFPLTLPPTIPLWQVALGIAFGVLVGKEIFGGTGMNVLNPALTGRAFLFFAYPAQISGDAVWIAANTGGTDIVSGATVLGDAAAGLVQFNADAMALGGNEWLRYFIGWVPGSMGEVSALACLFGALVLIITRVGAWQTMLGVVVGTSLMAYTLNAIGSETNPMFAMPWFWHCVVGGWAFGMVFMATDPVSSAFTQKGKLIYGFGIGVLVVLVRVVNPAYPEGMMLAILFMNMFAPLIDHVFVQANIKRRMARRAV